jgi:uncharacterized membrane protein
MTIMVKKTMTYSVMHLVVAFLVAWAVSGNLAVATAISLIEPMVQTVFYTLHEKLWGKVALPPVHHAQG